MLGPFSLAVCTPNVVLYGLSFEFFKFGEVKTRSQRVPFKGYSLCTPFGI